MRPKLTVTFGESLTLRWVTAVRREIAKIPPLPASRASSTISTPSGPVSATAAAIAPNNAAAGNVNIQPYTIRRALPHRTVASFRPRRSR